MAFRKYSVERIVKSIIECGEEISLEDIHFYYGLLAKKDPAENSTNWMIKLQALEANKYGENTTPGINLFMAIAKSGNIEQLITNITNNPAPISFDLSLESPPNPSINNMEIHPGLNQIAEKIEGDILSFSDTSTDTEIADDEGFKTVIRKNEKKK
ncbi:hypothetical protein AVEN_208262-1 [Araneus ventricosus]|uniref:Uncharacterized protein n=1 Tax=Araneus ventricosus TaxID=182803 RepID=A0A4Y2M0Y2_ARAVE|nr:hypothetical protein AVEN_208262-1 [Araneus ventricosus]